MSRFFFLFVISLLMCPTLSLAHHNSGSSTAFSSSPVVLRGLPQKPAPRLTLQYEVARLDESVGELHTLLIGGEYNLLKRFDLGFYVPVRYLNHNFRASSTGLGDVVFRFGYVFYEKARTWALLTSQWGLPTGDSGNGLGSGEVSQVLTLTLQHNSKPLTLFGSVGTEFEYANDAEPTLTADVGVISPRFLKKKLATCLIVSSRVFLDSDVFQSGSTKVLIEPQIHFYPDAQEHFIATLGVYVSAYDGLKRKSGVILTSTNNTLLSDVLWGGRVSLSYQFK